MSQIVSGPDNVQIAIPGIAIMPFIVQFCGKKLVHYNYAIYFY